MSVLRCIGILLIMLATGCAGLPEKPPLPVENALPTAATTPLDNAVAPREAAHPDQAGFVMLDEGRKAFAARTQITRAARRSLDIQTYIWRNDLTGRFLAHEILAAADQGIRVRLLLDDLDSRAKNDLLLALDQHPNIAVRLFNPMTSRRGMLGAAAEFLQAFHRLNHRMHIKNWIADNRIAIVGGRNVGDEYFTASEDTNFADFELLMLGPVVREASAAFDRYWNAAEVYPIALLNEQPPLTLQQVRAALEEARANALGSRYAAALQQDNAVQQLIGGQAQVYWRHDYQLVVDAPDKHRRDDVLDKSSVLRALLPRLERAQRELLIISPYFVPGKEGTALLVGLAQRGVRVKLLTNSLAANDVAAVHGGYSRYRTILLEGGVELWELKPEVGPINSSLLGSSGASLHTKALAVDGEMLFVGSYNLDPRSTALNAELGVLVDSSAMAQRFAEDFIRHTAGTYAWRVTLDNGTLQWHDDSDVKTREPAASVGRRLVAWLARVLRLDPLL